MYYYEVNGTAIAEHMQGTYTQDQVQAVVTYTDRNGQAQELTLGSKQMTVVSGYTVLPISAIPAADLDGEPQITFVEKGSGQATMCYVQAAKMAFGQ